MDAGSERQSLVQAGERWWFGGKFIQMPADMPPMMCKFGAIDGRQPYFQRRGRDVYVVDAPSKP
jgi:hypothetical protein